jgi:hypothetical protein
MVAPAGSESLRRRARVSVEKLARFSCGERMVMRMKVSEGRLLELPPVLDLEFPETVEVVMPGKLNGGMMRGEALDEDLALDIATAGAAGHLREELERALAGAKVRQMQGEVGVDDADERDIREMQALGDHLRADEDVDLADAKRAERLAISLAALHDIGIHAA